MPNLANIDNPYEDQEQEAFVKWLDDNGYPRFRVPNETYTKSHTVVCKGCDAAIEFIESITK